MFALVTLKSTVLALMVSYRLSIFGYLNCISCDDKDILEDFFGRRNRKTIAFFVKNNGFVFYCRQQSGHQRKPLTVRVWTNCDTVL